MLIEGRLRFEQWSDQNGQNRSKHSIQVENMEMLEIPALHNKVELAIIAFQTTIIVETMKIKAMILI